MPDQQKTFHSDYMSYNENSSFEMDNELADTNTNIAHSAQAAPKTVQWLIENFEPADGFSLRRSNLYNYYIHHCNEEKLVPVNAASFGKLIRSVFLGLKTRRLGTRGNSKYHYYGIRLKIDSHLNRLTDNNELSLSPMRTNSLPMQASNIVRQSHKRTKNLNSSSSTSANLDIKPHISSQQPSVLSNSNRVLPKISKNINNTPLSCLSPNEQAVFKNLGDLNQMPDFGSIVTDNISLPVECTIDDIKKFDHLFKQHLRVRLKS